MLGLLKKKPVFKDFIACKTFVASSLDKKIKPKANSTKAEITPFVSAHAQNELTEAFAKDLYQFLKTYHNK